MPLLEVMVFVLERARRRIPGVPEAAAVWSKFIDSAVCRRASLRGPAAESVVLNRCLFFYRVASSRCMFYYLFTISGVLLCRLRQTSNNEPSNMRDR